MATTRQPHTWTKEDVQQFSNDICQDLGVTVTQAHLKRDGGVDIYFATPEGITSEQVGVYLTDYEKRLS